MAYVRSAALTHPGRQRPNNEDFITFFEPIDQEVLRKSGCIYILADGVGGASKGERASQYAAQKILHDYYKFSEMPVETRLKTIIRQAGNDIYDYAESQDNFMQMATTIVVAVIRNNTLQVAHVGDSRAYLIHEEQVTQLTRDHSTIGELMRDGLLTEEEAMHFDGRNPLSRSLGGQRDVPVDVTEPIKFSPGNKILLSSDGLTRYATRTNINDLLKQGEPEDVVYRMIDYANQSGGGDNISVIIVEALDTAVAPSSPKGQKPTPVDWETIPTISKNFVYIDKKHRGKIAINRKKKVRKWAYALAGIGAVLLITVGLILGLSILNGSDQGISIVDTQISTDQSIPTPMESINDQLETGSSTEEEPGMVVPDLEEINPEGEKDDLFGGIPNPEPTGTPVVPQILDYAPEQTGWCTYQINFNNLNLDCAGIDNIHCRDKYPADTTTKQFSLYCLILCKLPSKFSQLDNNIQNYAEKIISLDYVYDPYTYEVIEHGWTLKFPDITFKDCVNAGGVFEVENE